MTTHQSYIESLTSIGAFLYEFLVAFHGDKPFEIRYVPEGKGRGKSISVMRSEGYFCTISPQGQRELKQFSAEGIEDLIISQLFVAADDSAPCFTVNSPNLNNMNSTFTTDNDIIYGGEINSQFVDVDAPEGLRHDEVRLQEWKYEMGSRILSFPLRPSCVIETKFGYHVYWLLEDGKCKLFRHVQMQLIQFFDGDEMCINEARVMRLPRFPHRKDPRSSYPVLEVLWEPERRYKQEELQRALPTLEEKTIYQILHERDSSPSFPFSQPRKEKLLDLISSRLDVVKRSEDKMITHCCMPDHADHNPSAWFDIQYMWFHCAGCGVHIPIDQLALELEWNDVIDEHERYDTNIDEELARIQALKVDVRDIQGLQLNELEECTVDKVAANVIDHFDSIGQQMTPNHRRYIYDLLRVLYKGTATEKPFLVPLEMGGGKSTAIHFFLREMVSQNNNFGAILVMERNESIQNFVTEFNATFGEQVAYAMYGFDQHECLLNQRDVANHTRCIARSYPFICKYQGECRYFLQFEDMKKFPIVVITFKRLQIDLDRLSERYRRFKFKGRSGERRTLLIDEKPLLINVEGLTKGQFENSTNLIIQFFQNVKNGGLLSELLHVMSLIQPCYVPSDKREMIRPLDTTFKFSQEFWRAFRNHFYYTHDSFKVPEMLESIVRNGAHRSVNHGTGDVILTTSFTSHYTHLDGFQTVIFDGTADIDFDYNHEEYHVLNFEALRSYEGLEFHICDSISASKTSMMDEAKVNAFCEDVKRIADEHPHEILYFPVLKQIESQVKENLSDYITAERIKVAHYGETRGSNHFRDCSIVVIGGILHKGEDYYIQKATAIYSQRGLSLDDIESTKIGNSRRFNDMLIEQVKIMDMLVDYSQEIKRTSQRDNSRNVQGKVFIFHNDKLLLDRIGMKFPGCKVTTWAPRNVVETGIRSKKNNGNQRALLELLSEYREDGKYEIYFEEIAARLNIGSKATSKLIKSKGIKGLLTSYNIRPAKDGNRKKLIWN